MEHFLINSSVCLFVLWIFYKLVLENTSWHRFKRWYLLGSIVIAIAIPFIVVKTVVIPIESSPLVDFANSSLVTEIMEPQEQPFNWTSIVISIYLLGVVVMLWRFVRNLRSFQINEEDEVKSYDNYALVLRQVMTVPHSFIKRIFVSKDQYVKQLIPEVVLEHEKAHLDQKHSLDILLIELLLIVFWFNLLLYLIRYSIKLNHEFLADRAVLQSGIQTSAYQETLLSYTQNSHSTALANTFNFPIIKKRFHIMKTKTSSTSLVLRSMMLLPLLALLIISCGKEETHYEEIEEVNSEYEKTIVIDSNKTSGYIIINESTHYYVIEDGKALIFDRWGDKKDYENEGYEILMVEEVKEEGKSFEETFGEKSIIIPNYLATSGSVKVDDKNYSFKRYNGAVTIYDENGNVFDYLKEGYKLIEVKLIQVGDTPELLEEYNRLAKKHKEYMDQNNTLIVFKEETARMQAIYNGMTPDQKANTEPWPYEGTHYGVEYKGGEIPPPPPPAMPPPPPPALSEVDKYNRWAREINAQNKLAKESGNNEYAIVKLKDVKKFEVIYNALSETQKKNAAPWPNFPPPPPPAQKAKQTASAKDGSWEDVEDYLNKNTEPKRHMIGDAVQVINLNRATLQAQYDGKKIHLDVAKKILVENGQNGVYLDTINNQPTMVIQSKYFYIGPALPIQSPLSGDGC